MSQLIATRVSAARPSQIETHIQTITMCASDNLSTRVNSHRLPNFIGRVVRLVGKTLKVSRGYRAVWSAQIDKDVCWQIEGNIAMLEASDRGQVKVVLPEVCVAIWDFPFFMADFCFVVGAGSVTQRCFQRDPRACHRWHHNWIDGMHWPRFKPGWVSKDSPFQGGWTWIDSASIDMQLVDDMVELTFKPRFKNMFSWCYGSHAYFHLGDEILSKINMIHPKGLYLCSRNIVPVQVSKGMDCVYQIIMWYWYISRSLKARWKKNHPQNRQVMHEAHGFPKWWMIVETYCKIHIRVNCCGMRPDALGSCHIKILLRSSSSLLNRIVYFVQWCPSKSPASDLSPFVGAKCGLKSTGRI